MSAACEAMNQMMGAAATALSEFLNKNINFSTPTAIDIEDGSTLEQMLSMHAADEVVSITFNLQITDIMQSDFISVITCELAKNMRAR